MTVADCLGTWAGAGLMTGASAKYGTALLGLALIIYSVIGLTKVRFSISKEREPVLGPLSGGITGLITAATGVFVIPRSARGLLNWTAASSAQFFWSRRPTSSPS